MVLVDDILRRRRKRRGALVKARVSLGHSFICPAPVCMFIMR